MPHCCVPKCSRKEAGHRFPKDPALCKQWIIAIRRDKFAPTPYSRVCKKHFTLEDYELPKDSVKQNPTPRLKKTAIPSQFTWTKCETPVSQKRRERARKRFLREISNADKDVDLIDFESSDGFSDDEMKVQCAGVEIECAFKDVGTECLICPCSLKPTLCDTGTQTDFSESSGELRIEDIMDKPKEIQLCTGFVDYLNFMLVFNLLGDAVNRRRYYPLLQKATQTRILSPVNEFFLTLVKLRCNSTFDQIALQFGVSTSLASNIFITWVNFLYCEFRKLEIWPSHEDVKNNMKAGGRNCPCTVIIDCTEVKIEKPTNPVSQQQTYSNYKQTNTVKVLIGMSPSGCVTFVADASGGSISDRQIFERCGIIDLLQDGDIILCDKGFNVHDLVAHKNVQVNRPVFLKGNQFTPSELRQSMAVSSDRIHVERIIGLGKTYKILSSRLSHIQVQLAGRIIYVCFMLANFRLNIVL